ncbi:hypothetical protein J6590_066151 [Homalodisca vitripennis]|nr:hypothetical protein J6590_066151 [Homalodisca vitripennis]
MQGFFLIALFYLEGFPDTRDSKLVWSVRDIKHMIRNVPRKQFPFKCNESETGVRRRTSSYHGDTDATVTIIGSATPSHPVPPPTSLYHPRSSRTTLLGLVLLLPVYSSRPDNHGEDCRLTE